LQLEDCATSNINTAREESTRTKQSFPESYLVERESRGAQRRDVFVLVGKLGLALAGTGAAIGVALALGLNRFMKEHLWLFHVKPTDPATFAAVGVLLVSIALLACYIPSRRAINVDPMTALRHE
jgi:ABC-type antimicrobial peptide transport system permease subunit